ncbi:unnamed protein product, partial [Sphacelaria rigidula]
RTPHAQALLLGSLWKYSLKAARASSSCGNFVYLGKLASCGREASLS